jgi:uncharacterized protein
MSLKVAKKTIDYFIGWITNPKRKTKHNGINIGFYGGEPLLEIQLIEKIMEYTRKRFREEKLTDIFNLQFSMTTNGALLKAEILDIIVKHNVSVCVSLDGPQVEHDKFRLSGNGKGTWSIIMENLEELRSKYPGYYKNHVKFLCTLHPWHDFQKIDQFFTDEKNRFDLDKIITNGVSLENLKESIKKNILENLKSQKSFLLEKDLSKRLENKFKLKKIDINTKFTAICRPGDWKLFIDTEGRFHFCEKIKADLPLGDVESGFDFDKIRLVYRAWTEMIIKNRCWECSIWSFCSICPAYNTKNDDIDIDCSNRKNDIGILTKFLSFKEEQDNKQRDFKKADNRKDYIRLLDTLT